MKPNRLKAQTICLQRMKELDPSGINHAMYEEMFQSMTDEEFHTYIQGLITGSNPLSVNIPNYSKVKISVENNLKMAKDMGESLMQRIWINDPATGHTFLSDKEYLVMEANVSRQIQTLDHKISTAKDNSKVDGRTGQPTGESRAAQLSGPEMMVLKSTGLKHSITELIKFRGGDNTSMRYLDAEIIASGSASMSQTPGAAERMPKSVKTMSIMLSAMMFKNNIAG